ncbi:MAG: carboxypeptidase-like regulatory domain-containing protein [Thermoguttaceae bacterium]|nr:carboxypeptidase-like regulatory domain-containing protein [Thermoguttaceae bacterium]
MSIKIAYRGKPVVGANVTLIPQGQSGRGASGVTDANGVAKMGLPGLVDGAVPGKYSVTVSKVEGGQTDSSTSAEEFYKQQQKGEPSGAPASPKHMLPVKYLAAGSSGLECVVKEQQDQVVEFNLTD